MLFITGLLSYHIYLISTNQTTKEELKNSYRHLPAGNPYKKVNCCEHWSKLFCNKRIGKKSTFDMMKEFSNQNPFEEKEKEKYKDSNSINHLLNAKFVNNYLSLGQNEYNTVNNMKNENENLKYQENKYSEDKNNNDKINGVNEMDINGKNTNISNDQNNNQLDLSSNKNENQKNLEKNKEEEDNQLDQEKKINQENENNSQDIVDEIKLREIELSERVKKDDYFKSLNENNNINNQENHPENNNNIDENKSKNNE